ncbi:MAG: MalY/PatB family protein [Gammaproteobacteria bacterium]
MSPVFDGPDLAALCTRRGTKWRHYGPRVIPAWVADMDFLPPEPIRRFMSEMVETGDIGYAPKVGQTRFARLFAERAAARYGWTLPAERVQPLIDVVQGIYVALQVYSEPGDGIIIQTPIYPPFLQAVEEMGRRLDENPLVRRANGYALDFDGLVSAIDERSRILMLCNPHNPCGRVLGREELERIAQIAIEQDLIVLSDEIHSDLLFDGREHVAFASLGSEVAERTVTFNSASKAFNTAGLRCALVAFGSQALQDRFNTVPERVLGGHNCFGAEATCIAWEQCEEWLEACVAYLQSNRDYLFGRLEAEAPGVIADPPEATYLAWLDCRGLGLNVSPFKHFLEHAKVGFSDGATFGEAGLGFVRLNFATPRAVLSEIIDRFVQAIPART